MKASGKLLANTSFSKTRLSPRILIIPPSRFFCNRLKFIWQGALPSEQQPVVLQAGLASVSSAEGTHNFNSLNFLTGTFAQTTTDPIFSLWTGSGRAGVLCYDSSVSARLEAAASDNSSWWNVEEAAPALQFLSEIKTKYSDPESSSERSESYLVCDFIWIVDKCSHSSFIVLLLGCTFSPLWKPPFSLFTLIDICYL